MLTRVAYGLKDRGGRHNNMLSHSYLFPVDQALLADPNVFLTVEDGNFTDDIQRAKQIPQELKRGEPYTLKSAMALCGLNRESYVQLIYAMYVQRESKRSLYIHSSKGEAVIRPFFILYLERTAAGLPEDALRSPAPWSIPTVCGTLIFFLRSRDGRAFL